MCSSDLGDLTLSFGGLRVPALVRFVLSSLFSSSSRAAAVSEANLRRRSPLVAAQIIEERTLSHLERGRCFMQEGEDAVPGRTQSRSGKGERCSGGKERCLAREQGRCPFLKERVADLKAYC